MPFRVISCILWSVSSYFLQVTICIWPIYRKRTGFQSLTVHVLFFWHLACLVIQPPMTLWTHASAWTQTAMCKYKDFLMNLKIFCLFIICFGFCFEEGRKFAEDSAHAIVRIWISFSHDWLCLSGKIFDISKDAQDEKLFEVLTNLLLLKKSFSGVKEHTLLCCTAYLSHSEKENSTLLYKQRLNFSSMAVDWLTAENPLCDTAFMPVHLRNTLG